jgi:hypothetical protein
MDAFADQWQSELDQMRAAALPLIEQLIALDEFHNPYCTLQQIQAWKPIWVKEEMERHGFVWDGSAWRRSEADRLISLTYCFRPGLFKREVQPTKYPADWLYRRGSSS